MQPAVRLGCVSYLNTLPLIEGLQRCGDVTIHTAVPSLLAPLLLRREADLALASLVDYARNAAELRLVPAGMIGCDGPTLTVRLFSAVPFERTERLHADTDSHTSVVLARLVLAARFGARPAVVDFDARERAPGVEWPDTLLLIGDKVVSDSPPAVRYPHQLDLGEAWQQWTGLPFVYACWMCRAEDESSPAIANASALLDRQRRRNTVRLDWLVQRYAAERRWPADLARRYVTELLRYEVTPRARAGAERFLAEAAAAGLLPAAPARWAGGVPAPLSA